MYFLVKQLTSSYVLLFSTLLSPITFIFIIIIMIIITIIDIMNHMNHAAGFNCAIILETQYENLSSSVMHCICNELLQ